MPPAVRQPERPSTCADYARREGLPLVSRAPATSLARLLSAYMASVGLISEKTLLLVRQAVGLQIRGNGSDQLHPQPDQQFRGRSIVPEM